MFGLPGYGDLTGSLPDGRRFDVVVSREGRPSDDVLFRLERLNEMGGVGLWTNSAAAFAAAAEAIASEGRRVAIDDAGICWAIP